MTMIKKLISHPGTYVFLMVILFIIMGLDLFQCESRYLYFTSEIGLILIVAMVYVSAFKDIRWKDPFEPKDNIPKPNWKKNVSMLTGWYLFLIALMSGMWLLDSFVHFEDWHTWFRSGLWFFYFVGVSLFFVIIVRKHDKFTNLNALIISTLIIVVILVGYEAIMLSWGHAWEYNHTIIAWALTIPLDNILFVYPVSPPLCMIIYSLVSRKMNNMKAFWMTNLILIPGAIIVELIAVYPLNLWSIFNDYSVWPMGKSNFEEFTFYIMYLQASIVFYAYFDRNLKGDNVTIIEPKNLEEK